MLSKAQHGQDMYSAHEFTGRSITISCRTIVLIRPIRNSQTLTSPQSAQRLISLTSVHRNVYLISSLLHRSYLRPIAANSLQQLRRLRGNTGVRTRRPLVSSQTSSGLSMSDKSLTAGCRRLARRRTLVQGTEATTSLCT